MKSPSSARKGQGDTNSDKLLHKLDFMMRGTLMHFNYLPDNLNLCPVYKRFLNFFVNNEKRFR